MKGEKGQVSHLKPMQIDTDLGYDVYKIFINVTSLNEIKAQDKIDFFSSISPSNVAIIIVSYLNEQDYLCAVSILMTK